MKNKRILLTGVAGFIGSNLLASLLKSGYKVRGIDNLSTGRESNLHHVRNEVGGFWKNFQFHELDVSDFIALSSKEIFSEVDAVIHLAALGSVPRSINNPVNTNLSNINGFINILELSKKNGIDKFIFASSSSVYGDSLKLPKFEPVIGKPLSPYALTKRVNEMYAEVFFQVYSYPTIALRFFNVFGPLQNPSGDYAAVIPRWLQAMLKGEEITIFGDGKTTRDFCYIENAVQMIHLALEKNFDSFEVFNVAVGEQTSLTAVANALKNEVREHGHDYDLDYQYTSFRAGDVRASLADISSAKDKLGYNPEVKCLDGIKKYVETFKTNS